jgi:hypothetical protein
LNNLIRGRLPSARDIISFYIRRDLWRDWHLLGIISGPGQVVRRDQREQTDLMDTRCRFNERQSKHGRQADQAGGDEQRERAEQPERIALEQPFYQIR